MLISENVCLFLVKTQYLLSLFSHVASKGNSGYQNVEMGEYIIAAHSKWGAAAGKYHGVRKSGDIFGGSYCLMSICISFPNSATENINSKYFWFSQDVIKFKKSKLYILQS